MKPVGHICELVRYSVKSMAGTRIDSAFLGRHGLNGDRRFAFRRVGDISGFPWLTASRLPELILYHPFDLDESTSEPLPTKVRTPVGAQVELRSTTLESEISERFGARVELMQLKNGIFDDASISMISRATVDAIGREVGLELDPRRFRPNIVVQTIDPNPFQEDAWIGRQLVFGESDPRAAVALTAHDVRCRMINLDPDTARQDAGVLKAVARLNANKAGVYGTVLQAGALAVGQAVSLVL